MTEKNKTHETAADGSVASAGWFSRFEPHCLLIAATRYYLGRMTISTCAFARDLAAAWPEIPEHTRSVLLRDIEDEFRRDDTARERGDEYKPLGMDCDRAAWQQVRNHWKNVELTRGADQNQSKR